jgi:hypothetical protein
MKQSNDQRLPNKDGGEAPLSDLTSLNNSGIGGIAYSIEREVREFRCWIDNDSPIRCGSPFNVHFQIAENSSRTQSAADRRITLLVYLHAPDCEVNLRYQDLTVRGREASDTLTFEVTAEAPGNRQLTVAMYHKPNMQPLSEYQCSVDVKE